VLATSMHGGTSTVLGIAYFNEISAKTLSSSWQARISTKGESDVWMLQNIIVPGGSFGWHSHPGPSLVIVKAGALIVPSGRSDLHARGRRGRIRVRRRRW